jgi:hypothetical protein
MFLSRIEFASSVPSKMKSALIILFSCSYGLLINPFFHKLRLIQSGLGFEGLPHGLAQASLIKAAAAFDNNFGKVLAASAADFFHDATVPAFFPQGLAVGCLKDRLGFRSDLCGLVFLEALICQDFPVGDAHIHVDLHAVNVVHLESVKSYGFFIRKLSSDNLTAVERYHYNLPDPDKPEKCLKCLKCTKMPNPPEADKN